MSVGSHFEDYGISEHLHSTATSDYSHGRESEFYVEL
jgi:hypothetical protein